MTNGYIKLIRSKNLDYMIANKPNAFLLLTVIALRTKITNKDCFNKLKIGQALIGDYKNYGLTYHQYRSSLKWLVDNEQITIKPTNKGSIVTLLNKDIYDTNINHINEQDLFFQRTRHEQTREQDTNKPANQLANENNNINILNKDTYNEYNIENNEQANEQDNIQLTNKPTTNKKYLKDLKDFKPPLSPLKKKSTFDEAIERRPECVNETIWFNWLDMRRKNKKSNSKMAVSGMINNINSLIDKNDANEMIKLSTNNFYTGLFPDKFNNKQKESPHNYVQTTTTKRSWEDNTI